MSIHLVEFLSVAFEEWWLVPPGGGHPVCVISGKILTHRDRETLRTLQIEHLDYMGYIYHHTDHKVLPGYIGL